MSSSRTSDAYILASGPRRRFRRRTVAAAMVTRPAVHPLSTTVGELRRFFEDEHVHIALLVDGDDELVGTVERADLDPELGEQTPAWEIAALEARTIRPDAELSEALGAMSRADARRLVVTTEQSAVVGLLCLKANGQGFCSDSDVAARRQRPC